MKTKKLLMIPGPSPVSRTILDEMGRETISFLAPEFVADTREVLDDLKEMFGTEGRAFVIAGTGTLGMEAAIVNSLKRGDSLLVVSHGYFGDRFVEIAERKGIEVDVLRSKWGETVSPGEIGQKLRSKAYKAVTVTHVDTSTGVMASIEEIGKIVREFEDTLLIVDGVCATGAIKEKIDEWGIDILLTGSQKAFGMPPGLTMVWAGRRALKRREEMGTIESYYADFNQWMPIMDDPSKYFATPAVNLIWALKESIRLMKEEGLENRYERHIRFARALQKALEALGFTLLASRDCRAYTLSTVLYPEGIRDAEFRNTLSEEGVVVAGGLGEYKGRMFRLGHMGNIDMHDLVSVICAIERALIRCGAKVAPGSGAAVVTKELMA
jgi:aspartate aminotransferase-like enzyme